MNQFFQTQRLVLTQAAVVEKKNRTAEIAKVQHNGVSLYIKFTDFQFFREPQKFMKSFRY